MLPPIHHSGAYALVNVNPHNPYPRNMWGFDII